MNYKVVAVEAKTKTEQDGAEINISVKKSKAVAVLEFDTMHVSVSVYYKMVGDCILQGKKSLKELAGVEVEKLGELEDGEVVLTKNGEFVALVCN